MRGCRWDSYLPKYQVVDRRVAGMSGGPLEMALERMTIDQEEMGGVPCIRGLRIPVATVVGMIAEG